MYIHIYMYIFIYLFIYIHIYIYLFIGLTHARLTGFRRRRRRTLVHTYHSSSMHRYVFIDVDINRYRL